MKSRCGAGAYGYQCAALTEPSSVDPALVCASGFADTACPNLTDFCCGYGDGGSDGSAD